MIKIILVLAVLLVAVIGGGMAYLSSGSAPAQAKIEKVVPDAKFAR